MGHFPRCILFIEGEIWMCETLPGTPACVWVWIQHFLQQIHTILRFLLRMRFMENQTFEFGLGQGDKLIISKQLRQDNFGENST